MNHSPDETLREIVSHVLKLFRSEVLPVRVQRKVRLDIVTDADRVVEESICNIIRRYHPDHAILAEESGGHRDSNHLWVIDPIDGTINFASGLPLFSVSLAYQKNGRTEEAAIILPALGSVYTASRYNGAFLGKNRLHVSTRNLQDAVISIILLSLIHI